MILAPIKSFDFGVRNRMMTLPEEPSAVMTEPAIVQSTFGRATVNPVARALVPHVHSQFNLLVRLAGTDAEFQCNDVTYRLTRGHVLIFNPWQVHRKLPSHGQPTLFLALLIEKDWLESIVPSSAGRTDLFPDTLVQMREEQQVISLQLASAIANNVNSDDRKIASLVSDFIISLVHADAVKPVPPSRRTTDARIHRAIKFMRAHANENPSMDDVAAEAGISRSRFYEQFKPCVGSSPQQYLDAVRLTTATHLLLETDRPLSDIAAELRFSELTNFTRFFTQHLGIPPAEFRRRTAILALT